MRNKTFFVIFLLIFNSVHTAMANQPPGPNIILGEILILPVMIILSFVGGAYRILKLIEENKQKKGFKLSRIINIIITFFLIFLSFIQEGFATVVALIFGIFALARGMQMIYWGIIANIKNPKPNYLSNANPSRLILLGSFIIIVTVFLVGMILASL